VLAGQKVCLRQTWGGGLLNATVPMVNWERVKIQKVNFRGDAKREST